MHGFYHLIGNFSAHPIFHLALSSIIIIFILVFLYIKHKEFHTTDQPPELFYLQKHKQLDLIPNIPNIVEVKTGMYLKNFPTFNLIENQFVLDALIWFEFNPSLIGLETIENFSFERGRVISKSLPEMKLEKNLLLVKYNIQLQFSTNLDHKYFPMNDHMLYIVLTNENISPIELFFTARDSSFTWSNRIHTQDWRIIGKTVRSGYADLLLDSFDKTKVISHPRVVYSLFLARSGMRKAALIFIPVLIVYILGTYSLILSAKSMSGSILSMGLGSVSGLLAYRFVIEKISPNVGYFTLTEYFFTIILSVSFVTFLIDFLRIIEPANTTLQHMSTVWFLITQLVAVVPLVYYLSKWHRGPKKYKAIAKILPEKIHKISERALKVSLKSLKTYAENTEEEPVSDDKNWLNLDYSSFYQKYTKNYLTNWIDKTLYFFNLKKPPAWSPDFFKACLIRLVQQRENTFNGNWVFRVIVRPHSKVVVWGDLQGAFHSLIRDLEKLKELGIIDDSLKITSPDDYFIFNGDLIDRSPYVLETLTVAMQLMLINPMQVFYIKGNHEGINVWQDFQTYKEIKAKTKVLGKGNSRLLTEYLERFFDTLPIAVYLVSSFDDDKGIVRVSHYRAKDLPYEEEYLGDFLFAKKEKAVDFLLLNNYVGKPKQFLLSALIAGLNRSTIYKVTMGLELLPPDKGATTWSILSSPITTYRKLYNFYFDNFAVIETKGFTNEWMMTLYSQDARKMTGFKTSFFHLVYGVETPNLDKLKGLNYSHEIKLACTLDLSKSAAILGERMREGLHLSIAQNILEGGINGNPMHLITLDDQYTPHYAKTNIISYLKMYHSKLIISPVGTPTTEALLPLIERKEILVMFPYSGADIFRKPELDHFVHFRPSYSDEAEALIHYCVHTLGLRRMAIFYQDDAYGLAPLRKAREIMKKLANVEWVEAPYQRNDPNIDTPAKKILEFNPPVILFFSTHAPSTLLIRKLGVNNLTDKVFLAISALTNAFRNFLRNFGLDVTISRVVPHISSKLPIIDEYRYATKNQQTFIYTPTEESLEGYINASIFSLVASALEPPYTKEKIIEQVEGITNLNFKGLELNFNPETRELSKAIWLDTGAKEWIIATLSKKRH